jgi:thiamine biosynthesis lipoprotein
MIHLHPPPDPSSVEPLPSQELEIGTGSYRFRDESILGTRMHIDLVARNYSDALAAAQAARAEIDRLDAIFNHRRGDSELSHLNRSHSHQASPELFAVIEAAERWRLESNGAFSGRLGRVAELWSNAINVAPSRTYLSRAARAAEEAHLELDASTLTIVRPSEVQFSLDALAKGWIVDRAFEVARESAGVSGAMIDIGGDIRCGGRAPDARGWCIGIPNAIAPADNAPLVAKVRLSDRAIATSGRGPRDRLIDGVRYSPTLSPLDGWPVTNAVSVNVIAPSTAEADAIATILLAMPVDEGLAWANAHDVVARIETADEVKWTRLAQVPTPEVRITPVASPRAKTKTNNSWPQDWSAYITFTAPPRQLVRDHNFRSPFMAMWITDLDNKPVRTLLLVGKDLEWQRDNYIWWNLNPSIAETMVNTRSMSTAGAGVYKILWDGVNDAGEQMPGGTYVLHIETSRERGRHTHRSMELDFSKPRQFSEELPSTEEAGGVRLDFYRPNGAAYR